MVVKRKYKKKKLAVSITPEQKRNGQIFRLRGYYANARTLPFLARELDDILFHVDNALERLDAETQTDYMIRKPK